MSESKFLGADSSSDIDVRSSGDPTHPTSITVVTQYARFTSNIQMSVTGQAERWSTLETLPAFEVAMLIKNGGQLHVQLMQKIRKQGENWRTKLPGGYLHGPIEEYAQKKILADTGLQFDFQRCKELPPVIGHAEIITPIRLFYTFQWEVVGKPRQGVRLLQLPLQSAIEMSACGEIENDSSFAVLMRLWYLHTTDQL